MSTLVLIGEVCRRLAPGMALSAHVANDGAYVSFMTAPWDWDRECMQLVSAVAMAAVDLVPSWKHVPRPPKPALVYLPEGQEVLHRGLPPSHRVVMMPTYVAFAREDGPLDHVVPYGELVERVVAEARSWLPQIRCHLPAHTLTTLLGRSLSTVDTNPSRLATALRHFRLVVACSSRPMPLVRVDLRPCFRALVAAGQKSTRTRLALAAALRQVVRTPLRRLRHARAAPLPDYRRWSAWRAWRLECRRAHRAARPVDSAVARSRLVAAWRRFRLGHARGQTVPVREPPPCRPGHAARRVLWRLRVRPLTQSIRRVWRLKTAIDPLHGISGYTEHFIASWALLCSPVLHLGMIAILRLLRRTLACGNPKAHLHLVVSRLRARERVAEHQCHHCFCNLVSQQTRCPECAIGYCDARCMHADHDASQYPLCCRIGSIGEPQLFSAEIRVMRLQVEHAVCVYADQALTSCDHPGRVLLSPGAGNSLPHSVMRTMAGVATIVAASTIGVLTPGQAVVDCIVRQLPQATAFCQFVNVLAARLDTDEWQHVMQAARKLPGRQPIRLVLAACFKQKLIMPSRGTEHPPEFWLRTEIPEGLVVPSRVLRMVEFVRITMWGDAAPLLFETPCHALFATPPASHRPSEHPHLVADDTRRGFGALYDAVATLLDLEYKAVFTPLEATLVRIAIRDPMIEQGGHPLLSQLAASVRHQLRGVGIQPNVPSMRSMSRDRASLLSRQLASAVLQAKLSDQLSLIQLGAEGTRDLAHAAIMHALEVMSARAVFGVLRTFLYSLGQSPPEVGCALAHWAMQTGLPPGAADAPERVFRALSTQLGVIECRWPWVVDFTRAGDQNLLTQWVYLTFGDWAAVLRFCLVSAPHLVPQIMLDRVP